MPSGFGAHRVVAPNPPELRTDTVFRRKRLAALAQAGLPTDEVDGEWSNLLRDFPEDVPLHLELTTRYGPTNGWGRQPLC